VTAASRRMLLAAPFAVACRRGKAIGFPGFAFVANSQGSAVAAVDLTTFTLVRHIRLDDHPAQLISLGASVYALTPATGSVHELDPARMAFRRKTRINGTAIAMQADPSGRAIWVLCRENRELARLSLETFTVDRRVKLPAPPLSFALSPETPQAAIATDTGIAVAGTEAGAAVRTAAFEGPAGPVAFLKNGRLILAGDPANSRLAVLDPATAAPVAHLPLAVKPRRFCFNQDGGQLFITGEGGAVAIVYPYQTQVAGTILAGHAPGAMAASASPDYLFVANPATANVSVIDIGTQRLAAVVPVGSGPSHIAITPDHQYALVLNEQSGDMAVIRIAVLTQRRTKAAPLFTMVPVGSGPLGAVVRAAG